LSFTGTRNLEDCVGLEVWMHLS